MPSLTAGRRALLQAFADYGGRYPRESVVDAFIRFFELHTAAFERRNSTGHFTGSAWLVSADGARVLLTHHRKLGLWMQLGGHADGDPDLMRVALREAEEESGLSGLTVEPSIFDLDRHCIPAHGSDPEHWHFDVRFVVRAGLDEAFVVSDESHALAWRGIGELAVDDSADASVRRMAGKWLVRECLRLT